MKRLTFALSAIIALGVAPLAAQQTGVVRGLVTDNTTQQPIAGVSIILAGRSTHTTPAGRFFLSAPAGRNEITARIVGYSPSTSTVTVVAGDTVSVDFALTPQAIQLSEIVSVGYGEEKAGNITGAVTTISADQFNTGQVVSPQSLIENKIAGVQLVDNNEPGGGISIRIRGATSINASSEPLYVIDGMPVGTGAGGGLSAGRDPLNFLNPDDIASMTVLKDASAAAIYGANAANGVVIITTKSGRGRPRVEYSSSFSSASVTRLPQMLNATEFRAAVTQYGPPANVAQLGNANTDWFGLIDRTAYGTDQNIVVSGGGTNSYRLSLGYLDANGIIRGSSTQRVSLGVNSDLRFLNDHLDVRTNLKGSRAFDRFTPGGVLSNAAQMGPTQPVYDTSAVTGFYNNPGGLQSPDNPLEILTLGTSNGTTYRSVGNVQAEYTMPFFQALKANVNLGYDVTKASQESFNPNTLHREIVGGQHGFDFRNDNSQVNTVFETYLNYAAPLRFVRGDIDLTGGYSFTQSNATYPSTLYQGLSSNLLGTNGVVQASTVTPQLDIEDSRLISFFGRANYNLNDRYLAAVTLRRDGSSRFGPNNAWGYFPSVALAWRVSQEGFMRRFTNLSDLKLRATWAKTGNQNFANYQQYAAYLYGNTAAQVQFGNTFVPTIRPNAVDPNIKWEATNSVNLGFDYGFSNQRFNGSFDWYVKKTSDLIFTVPAPAGTNFSNFVTTNIGSMKNTGVEFSLNFDVFQHRTHGLNWTTNFNVSHNKNELTAITSAGSQIIQVGGVAGGVGTTIQELTPGQPINSFYVCPQSYLPTGKPDQGKYVSLGDSVVSGCDAKSLRAEHDPAPHWIFGHTSYLTYGHLDFSFTLRAWLGNYVYNNVASNLGTYSEVTRGSPFNLNRDVLNTGFTQPQYLSDYYVKNGSFLRMDNITIGYGFSYHGTPMRVFGSVQNVFTITGYDGVDPTAGLNGIDNNIYPRSRTMTAGLTVRL